MMTIEARSIRCPERVLGWIPWYGETADDGGPLLDSRQRGAVEAHASECADCRSELDLIAGAPFEIDIDLPDPDRMFNEITARIDAGEADGFETAPLAPEVPTAARAERRESSSSLSDDEIRRLTSWVLDGDRRESASSASKRDREATSTESTSTESTSSTGAQVIDGRFQSGLGTSNAWAAVAAAAIFVLGLVGGGLIGAGKPMAAGSDTYVSAAAAEALVTDSAMIDVVFVDSATAGEIASALRSVGVEIISGPSGVGRYRVRVAGEGASLDQADLAAITARLKAGPAPIALFAEPVLK